MHVVAIRPGQGEQFQPVVPLTVTRAVIWGSLITLVHGVAKCGDG